MSDIDRIAFVTVGSTRFDTLVARVLSHEVLEALIEQGFTRLVVQVGSSHVSLPAGLKMDKDAFQGVLNDLDVTMWRYKPALNEEYERAQLVIGHAGSGTILEVLRLGCRMIAVPNETLLHNHQSELAEALESRGFLLSSSVADLPRSIATAMTMTFEKFPDQDSTRFSNILDKEMGFM